MVNLSLYHTDLFICFLFLVCDEGRFRQKLPVVLSLFLFLVCDEGRFSSNCLLYCHCFCF